MDDGVWRLQDHHKGLKAMILRHLPLLANAVPSRSPEPSVFKYLKDTYQEALLGKMEIRIPYNLGVFLGGGREGTIQEIIKKTSDYCLGHTLDKV